MLKLLPQLNPVLVRKIDQYELIMLVSLTIHTRRRIDQFEKTIQCMKQDYQKMYDSMENKQFLMNSNRFSPEIQYIEKCVTAGLDDYSSDSAQISMAIQKSKYDGSDEKFKEWIPRFMHDLP